MELNKIRQISRWVFHYLRDELSDQEMKDLKEWRLEQTDHERVFKQLTTEENWDEHIRKFVKSEHEVEAEWSLIRKKAIGSPVMKNWKRWSRYAALFTITFGISVISWWFLTSQKEQVPPYLSQQVFARGNVATLISSAGKTIELGQQQVKNFEEELHLVVDTLGNILKYQESSKILTMEYHTLLIPRGGEYVVVLSDNTKVYLNSESELRYPVCFSGKERRVVLKGEAYFEVATNKEVPFIVETKEVDIKVLGTQFDVRAYDNEAKVLTTLVSGRVNVFASENGIDLMPNQQAIFNKEEGKMEVHSVDVREFVGWKDGRLIFDNVLLGNILSDLGRWYNFDVLYANEKIKSIPFSLDIAKHDRIEDVLSLIEHTGKLSFTIDRNVVIVK